MIDQTIIFGLHIPLTEVLIPYLDYLLTMILFDLLILFFFQWSWTRIVFWKYLENLFALWSHNWNDLDTFHHIKPLYKNILLSPLLYIFLLILCHKLHPSCIFIISRLILTNKVALEGPKWELFTYI